MTFDHVDIRASDSDHDDIPNEWELEHYGSITGCVAGADSDLDGLSDYGEYVTGCDPTNASSVFMAAGSAPASGNILQWPYATGRLYTVYCATNLTSGFTLLVENLGINTYTDTLHSASASIYYRIEVEVE